MSTDAAGGRSRPSLRGLAGNRWSLLVLPAVVFLAVFFLAPLVTMSLRSVTDPQGAGLSNYTRFFGDEAYLRVLINTFWIALVSTVTCLVVGYPFAYLMTVVSGRVAGLLLIAVLLPFWSSLLVRTFAWQGIRRDPGTITRFLVDLGLISSPLTLIRTTLGVILGMSHILLPFMVLPLYAVMRRIDPEYGRAAANLGAPPMSAFLRVFVPLSLPGVVAGCLLVFAPWCSTGAKTPPSPPQGFSLQWYQRMFRDPQGSSGMLHSAQVAVLTAILATVLGTLAPLGLARGRFPGRTAVNALALSPLIVPVVIIAIGMFSLFVQWRISRS